MRTMIGVYTGSLQNPKHMHPENDPITSLCRLGDYWEDAFWILQGGLGLDPTLNTKP